MKRLFNRIVFPMLMLNTLAVSADDSDIYINDPGAAPYAVFALDYRPNIFSNTCNNTGHPTTDPTNAADCLDKLGEDYTVDGTTGDIDTTNAGIYNFITSPTGLNKSGVDIDPWEQMLAVYAVALQQIPKEINIALAISHNDTCTGGGTTAGTTVSGCSNGGYILKGFTNVDPTDAAKTGVNELIASLLTIPSASGGSVTHLFQGAELYYEISRYLRGNGIWNAHLGWDSYVSNSKGTDEYNLNNDLNRAADGRCTAAGSALCTPTIVGQTGSEPDPSIIDTADYSNMASSYNDPYTANDNANECTKTYVINNFFKESQQESNSNDEIEADPDLGIDSVGSDPFDDLVTAFATEPFANGQPVQSIFVAGAQAIQAGKVPDYSLAGTPDGEDEIGPFARDNAREFLDGLIAGLSAILSKSATFVAASVPVNVFNRVEVVDNVYLALFQADRDANPFWPGNVKKLKIVADPDDDTIRVIVDSTHVSGSTPVPAFDTDGLIKRSALSYWTDAGGYDMSANFSTEDLDVAGKDGRSTNRGGAGQQIPGLINGSSQGTPGVNNTDAGAVANKTVGDPAPRKMYTEPTTSFTDGSANDDISGDGLIPLNADATLSADADIQSALGVATSSETVELLAWLRGIDAVDADLDGALEKFGGNPKDTVTTRNWFMGDALHSQPLPVNYGCADPTVTGCEQRIRLFFGTNDGIFHMVRNTNNSSGAEEGDEIGGFIPHSSLDLASILSGGPTIPTHPYGMDGRPVSLIVDNDNDGHIESGDNDKVYLYITMRRGGDEVFAFDISNPDIPPKLIWKINSASSDFTELGMTFSNPTVGVVQTGVQSDAAGGAVELQTAVVFAGGMCGGWNATNTARLCKDLDGHMGPDTEGTAIYVVNALTGALIWKATGGASASTVPNTSSSDHFVHPSMIHSIPSDITLFDSNKNGILDRGYVGDTGGNVWRIDLPEASPDVGGAAVDGREQWFVGLFAQLGIDAVDPAATAAVKSANDRRFYHAPDVVQTYLENNVTPVDKVVITSGDRPHPREDDVDNTLFALNDLITDTGSDALIDSGSGLPLDSVIVKADLADTEFCLSDETSAACVASASDTEGWFLDYEQLGEKGLSKPLVVDGTVFATSYLPNGEPGAGGGADICSPPEGSSRLYALSLNNGAPTVHLSDNLDTKFVPIGDGLLGDVKPLGSDFILVPGTGVDGKQIFKAAGRSQLKIYWYEKGLDIP